jgi:hypothetical protein
MFSNIFYYTFEHGPVVNPGDTMEIEGGMALRFRAPREDEELYDSSSGTLVLERM